MRVLPPLTDPPDEAVARRHQPRPAGDWTKYKDCLRWDFGFTCAFCLLHEADFFHGLPSAGLGVMTVEHRVPKSVAPELKGQYSNCILACRLCNQARGTSPIDSGSARLLDPTEDAWASHFVYAEAELRPRPNNADAEYTHTTYEVNSASKVARREARQALIEDRLQLLRDFGSELEDLLALAEKLREADDPAYFDLWQGIRTLRDQAARARRDLRRYKVIPDDAPRGCRCSAEERRRLPSWLETLAHSVD